MWKAPEFNPGLTGHTPGFLVVGALRTRDRITLGGRAVVYTTGHRVQPAHATGSARR